MKRRKSEYFIGMVDSYSANRKYSKRRKRRSRRLFLRRGMIVTLCLLVIAGLFSATYFLIVPAVKNLFSGKSASASTVDEATPDEALPVVTIPAATEEVTTEATTEAPTEPPTEATTKAPTQAPTTSALTTEPPTTAPEIPLPDANEFLVPFISEIGNIIKEFSDANKPEEEYVTPVINDNGKDGTLYSTTLYLWKNAGFNLFGSTDKVAKNYSKTLNDIVKGLDEKITVYNMVIPNHTEFGLPQRIKDEIGCTSQAENLKTIAANLSDRITSVNCYNALAEHNDEYIYYRTDHHWTSLGAYYAYTSFCEATDKTPLDITTLKKNSIDGFTGSFYTLSGSSTLYKNSDTVTYYTLPNKTSAQMKERMSSSTINCDVYYPASTAGTLTYGVFCWGDTAQFVIKSDAGTGKKIAVVKDSYGNAFAPYLTAHYDEVHLLDYRYYDGNLNDYLKKNGIDEVLFLNNTMSANSTSQVATMKNALK